MKRTCDIPRMVGTLVSVLVVAAAAAGCGGSKAGVLTGGGGALQGVGGATAIGAGGASLGTGGAMTGTGGVTGAAGSGAGGLIVRGTGGNAGGRATGGAGGNGGRTTLVSGTGGRGIDAGAAGTGAGGRGTGGKTTGGAGGAATGGATGWDGGTPTRCSDITAQTECDARSDCHSVFKDPRTCACTALGCCARFVGCADGGKASCTGPALCDMVEPYCEGPYVIAFRNNCYEGCVKQTDCALPPCPPSPPGSGAACGPLSQTCYYEDCAGAGRTVATCSAGTNAWQVTTSPCAATACQAPDSSSGLTCAAGQVCILITGTGPIPPMTSAVCADHTCGKGPITPECLPDLHGTCRVDHSEVGTVFRCELVADCGDAGCA